MSAETTVAGLPDIVRRAYEEQGRSVLPCGADKRPLVIDGWRLKWKTYQTRRATPDELAAWSVLRPPIWAQATGRVSGIVTADFDGERGLATMRQWDLQPHRRTGSGGAHVDVVYPDFEVPTLNGKSLQELGRRWPGFDIRATGGYAAIWGRSAHGEYQQLRDLTPDSWQVIPSEVWKFIRERGTAPLPPVEPEGPVLPVPVDWRLTLERALDMAGEVGRNNGGFWLACRLRDGGIPEPLAEDVMQEFCSRVPTTNSKGNAEAYSWMEALGSLRSAYRRPARSIWQARPDGLRSPVLDQRARALARRMGWGR